MSRLFRNRPRPTHRSACSGNVTADELLLHVRAELDLGNSRLVSGGSSRVASLPGRAYAPPRAEWIATDTLIHVSGETDYSVIIVARSGENMIITSASQAESVTG